MMSKCFSFLLFILVFCSGCTNSVSKKTEATGQFQKIEVAAFKAKIQALTNEQIIDVRTPAEFQAGALENAVNINYYDKNYQDQINQLDKTRPVMLYCKSGGRSGKTLAMLKDMGFKEAYDMIGGYTAWSATQPR